MTMNIFAPSSTVRVGDTVQLPFFCSEPGEVTFTSDDEGVATVEASKTVEGVRVWRTANQRWEDGYNVPASGAHAIRQRDNCTIGFYIDTELVQNAPLFIAPEKHLVSNYSAYRRINWHFDLRRITDTQITLNYSQSNTAGTNESTTSFANRLTYGDKHLVIVTFSGTTLTRYLNNNTPEDTLTRTAPTGVDDNPYCRIYSADKFYYWDSILSSADIAAWMAGTPTSVAPVVGYPCNEESATLIAYDESGNNHDSVFGLDSVYPSAQIVRVYTDTAPVVPYSTVTVVAQSAGTCTISARRRRNGIPYRTPPLPDAEVYEDATYVLTVEEALASEQSTVQLMIYADRDGTADIAMDNPIIDFPASAAVVEGKNQVSGLVTGSGTCNVTVTLDGVSDTTQFIVSDIDVNVGVGPDLSLDWPGEDITASLLVSCDRPGTTVDLSYSDPSITGPASVLVGGPPVEITIIVSNYGNFVVTGAYGSHTDTCGVSVADRRFVTISPDVVINELDPNVYLTVTGSCDGEVALSVAPATGLVVSSTVTLVGGTAELVCTAELLGDYVVTASYLTKSDTASVEITEVPVLVKIGPDDDDITMLHIVTNRPGDVYLTSDDPDHVTLPDYVTVPSTLETQVRAIFAQSGIYTITATFRSASDHCIINYDADYCYVSGTIIDVGGRPVRDAVITFKPVPVTQTLIGSVVSKATKIAYTDRDGRFEIPLIRGAQIIAACDIISYRKVFTVPDQAYADIEDL